MKKASRGVQSIMVARTKGAKITTTYQFNEVGICHGVINTCIVREVVGIDHHNPFTPVRKKVF